MNNINKKTGAIKIKPQLKPTWALKPTEKTKEAKAQRKKNEVKKMTSDKRISHFSQELMNMQEIVRRLHNTS
jgi:hypothetical protein